MTLKSAEIQLWARSSTLHTLSSHTAFSPKKPGTSNTRIFVDSFDAALNMALHGNGVALVSEVLAHSTLASGQLVRAHVDGRPCEEGYYVRADEKNAAALQFRDWIFELVQSENPRN